MPKVSEAYLEARRTQILEAAWSCFALRGYHETTMQDICKQSGLSYGALYRYFASKEDILRATSERARAEAYSLVAQARADTPAPLEAVARLGEAVFGSVREPNFDAMTNVHLQLLPETLRRPEFLEIMRGEIAAWRTSLTALLRDAYDAGQLPPEVDPEGLALLLICAWEGLRVHHLISPDDFPPERVYNAIGALLAGKQPE